MIALIGCVIKTVTREGFLNGKIPKMLWTSYVNGPMSTSFASVISMVFTKNWPLKTYHLLNLARSLVELGTILCDSI